MKKIISLGGNFFQTTIVKAAKRLGAYVIDVDFFPENPAHRFANEYHNISTLDRDGVLKLASELKVDGIVSFASDVSAPTAAYVAEKLGLPGNPLETVEIMTDKSRFHPFLKDKGFFMPDNVTTDRYEDIEEFYKRSNERIILKPIMGSGTKGISIVEDVNLLKTSFDTAMSYSNGKVVAETFIKRSGHQIAGDAFVVDGKVVFFGLANEHFDSESNPLVPVGESFPASLSDTAREKAISAVQNALSELGYQNGAVNLDFHYTPEGDVFLIELGPRNGGNLITDAIKISSGVDLAEYTVKVALGENVSDLKDKKMERFIASYIWHSAKDGEFEGIRYDEKLRGRLIQTDLFVKRGDRVGRYVNGSYGIGAALIEFDNKNEMMEMMDNMNRFYEIELEYSESHFSNLKNA